MWDHYVLRQEIEPFGVRIKLARWGWHKKVVLEVWNKYCIVLYMVQIGFERTDWAGILKYWYLENERGIGKVSNGYKFDISGRDRGWGQDRVVVLYICTKRVLKVLNDIEFGILGRGRARNLKFAQRGFDVE